MQISERLLAVAKLAGSGKCIADVGTDHAYLPIWLIREKKYSSAIAMDINKGPLQRAQEHIRLYGLDDQIMTRLSNGIAGLLPKEADTIVISGMGGPLTISILENGQEVLKEHPVLILQPQSQIADVRKYLVGHGWVITAEDMVLEEGKFYPMMRAAAKEVYVQDMQVNHADPAADSQNTESGEETAGTEDQTADADGQKAGTEAQSTADGEWTEAEYSYGKDLLNRKHPVLKAFLEKEAMSCKKILESFPEQETQTVRERKKELEEMLQKNAEAMQRMKI